MTDKTELKRLADAATQGEWQVVETKLPCRLGLSHIERRIFTVKDHPQLEAPYPIVNGSVALGTDETPVHHMVSMTAENAAFIAAANPVAIKALLAENERLSSDEQEATDLCDRLSDLLRSTAIEVRGPEEPLKRHSFHDLPSRIKTVISERDQLKADNEALRRAMHELANHPKLTASQADILRAAMGKGEQS